MNFMMCNRFPNILIHPNLWRFVGFGSSIVGFSCYALCPSFHGLFGQWNLLKIVLYSIMSFIFSVLMLFVSNCRQFPRGFFLQTNVGFLVLMLTSLYSLYEDRINQGNKKIGYKNILSLISSVAFALMSMSLSRQIQPGFEVGMSNFFLGCLLVAVMKLNFKLAVGAAILCYVLISIRSYSDSQLELHTVIGGSDTEHIIVEIGSQSHHEIQSLADNEHLDENKAIVYEETIIRSALVTSMLNLRFLDLSFTCIEALPDSLSNLNELLILRLKSCGRLRYVPPLGRLQKLEELDLSDTAITKVPEDLEMLLHLKFLNLRAPNLKLTESWTSKISNLPCLQHFIRPKDKSV